MTTRARRTGHRRAFALVGAVFLATGLLGAGSAIADQFGGSRQDVYVTPRGSDYAPGTQFRPVRTVERAQELVRQRAPRLTADLTVHLAPGVFRLDKPLVLDSRDSGANGHRIIWQGSGQTVLSGGRQVTGWRPVPGRAGLYSAPEPAGMDNTRQLYVDGVREQRAQGPLPVSLRLN